MQMPGSRQQLDQGLGVETNATGIQPLPQNMLNLLQYKLCLGMFWGKSIYFGVPRIVVGKCQDQVSVSVLVVLQPVTDQQPTRTSACGTPILPRNGALTGC